MMSLVNIKNLALLVWGIVNAALVVEIGSELAWGEKLRLPLPSPVVHQSEQIEITLPPDYRLPSREQFYVQTLERPLFVPSRSKSPPVPPPPPPPPPAMQKGQFQLLGTIITDEMKVAVLREISSGKERQVVEGYTINGLQLDRVEANRIMFTQYGDQEELRLKIQPSSKAVSAPKGGQPATRPSATFTPGQRGLPSGRSKVLEYPGGRIERPATLVPPPQTLEDRARDPLLQDFYKK